MQFLPALRRPAGDEKPNLIERKTLVVALAIYGSWAISTYFYRSIPLPLIPLVGGWILAWQGSLQHETIHGHPTRLRTLNSLIGCPPLSLWLPYERYRQTHLAHHGAEDLTCPVGDPESRYLAPRPGWAGWLQVGLMRWNATLLGRLTLGPAIEIATFLAREAAALARGDRRRWAIWGLHLLQVALVVAWLKLACHMSLALYAAAFVYPGAALSLLRSFAEHRAAEHPGHRIAIVENAPLLGLLFLNNNLHAVHHRHPGAAWTQLPAIYGRRRADFLRSNGGLVYNGYRDVVRRYLFAPHDALFHPARTTEAAVKP